MFSENHMRIMYSIALGNQQLGLFGTLKLALALQFIVTNAYFSVARTLTLVLHATLKEVLVTMNCNANTNFSVPNKLSLVLGYARLE